MSKARGFSHETLRYGTFCRENLDSSVWSFLYYGVQHGPGDEIFKNFEAQNKCEFQTLTILAKYSRAGIV